MIEEELRATSGSSTNDVDTKFEAWFPESYGHLAHSKVQVRSFLCSLIIILLMPSLALADETEIPAEVAARSPIQERRLKQPSGANQQHMPAWNFTGMSLKTTE
jgi:hypothetical protein